jgi:cell division protein FtsI/penicillin-binding protein 2
MKQSPLLEKAKRISGAPHRSLPRKGRIRAALAVALIGIAAKALLFGDAAPGSGNRIPNQAQPAGGGKHARTPAKKTKKARAMDFADVRALMQQHAPRLDRGADTVHSDGMHLALHYSVDTALQRTARALMRRYHPRHGSIVALDPATGRVLALHTYDNPDDSVSLGSATAAKNIFPAASIFKTITAAGAIESGLEARSMLKTHGRNHTLYKYQLEPRLERFREVSLGEAYAYSINPVFGRLGIYVLKAEGIRDYGRKFGFNAAIPFELGGDKPLLTVTDSAFFLAELASGFNQSTRISPLFGALIAASIAADGVMPAPSLVDSIIDLRTGKRCYAAAPRPWRKPISARTARQMQTLMHNVARYGTARKAFRYVKRTSRFSRITYGGKTGNVDMASAGRTDWFVGFARHETDSAQRIAAGVVTVHGPYWTVHSSFVGAELMRHYIRNTQIQQKRARRIADSLRTIARAADTSRATREQ